jgi:hypothetical protein
MTSATCRLLRERWVSRPRQCETGDEWLPCRISGMHRDLSRVQARDESGESNCRSELEAVTEAHLFCASSACSAWLPAVPFQ